MLSFCSKREYLQLQNLRNKLFQLYLSATKIKLSKVEHKLSRFKQPAHLHVCQWTWLVSPSETVLDSPTSQAL